MPFVLLTALALAGASPAADQATPPAPPPANAATAATPADPERMALARQAIDYLWPLGTYRRLIANSMDGIAEMMVGTALDMKTDDMVPPGARPRGMPSGTLREVMAKQDPYFEERMRILYRVMGEEMAPIASHVEPQVREALATIYARRFTAEQLADMNRFFATPSGRAYAADSLTVYTDPEMTRAMAAMMPEMMKAMPAIMNRFQTETAHLPPPKGTSPHPARPGG
ncbi:MAG: hypothetical protein QOJ94_1804 [Sphingomonadales bacterium]|jgi:hypothetical protein|nr:hypothetical protein [Sphingomonadales bacterium]